MNDFLTSKNFSFACMVLNGFFAVISLMNGDLFWALLCGVFSWYCYNNWRN